MRKFVTALIATVVAGLVTAASTDIVNAGQGHPHCGTCGGPIAPTTYYKTVHPLKSYTRYHDTSVFRHVTRVHKIVNVVRVQPIVRIHDVTRIHHRTIVNTVNAYRSVTQQLPPIQYVHYSTQNLYDCGCGY